jgi:glyoxylase I family protein
LGLKVTGRAHQDNKVAAQSAPPRLHHVAVGTRDVERLAAFYSQVFGLVERARFEDAAGRLRSIWLDLCGPILMIERTDEPARHVELLGAGPFLLAFAIAPAERDAFEAALGRAGAAIERRSEFSSYTRDPDGNRLAISHYPHGRGEGGEGGEGGEVPP